MVNRATLFALLGLWLLSCGGCGQHTPAEAVRKRWNQLIASALSRYTDAGLKLIDPAYVSRQGSEEVKQRHRGFGDLLRAGRLTLAFSSPKGLAFELAIRLLILLKTRLCGMFILKFTD
jgi:hypothetical protein